MKALLLKHGKLRVCRVWSKKSTQWLQQCNWKICGSLIVLLQSSAWLFRLYSAEPFDDRRGQLCKEHSHAHYNLFRKPCTYSYLINYRAHTWTDTYSCQIIFTHVNWTERNCYWSYIFGRSGGLKFCFSMLVPIPWIGLGLTPCHVHIAGAFKDTASCSGEPSVDFNKPYFLFLLPVSLVCIGVLHCLK